MRRLAPALVSVVLFVLAAAIVDRGLLDSEASPDVARYVSLSEQMRAGAIPYRDIFVEYPPGALPALAVPAIAPSHGKLAFKAAMAACGAVAVAAVAAALMAAGASRRRIWAASLAVALSPLALGPILFNAFDLWPAALTAVAIALAVRARHAAAAGFGGIATAAKIFPIVLLPLLLLQRRWQSARVAAIFLSAALLCTLPFVVLAPGGVGHSLRVQAERGLQIESLGASGLLALEEVSGYRAEHVTGTPGSHDVGGPEARALAAASSVLVLVAVASVIALAARQRPEADVLFTACAAALAGIVAFGKVLSPQYLVWLVPVVPLVAGGTGLLASAILLLAVVATRLWFVDVVTPFDGGPDVLVLLSRNLLLVCLFAVLVARLAQFRRLRGPSAAETGGLRSPRT